MAEDPSKTAVKDEKQDSEKPLEKMTAKELREVAKDIPGVTGVTAMKKEELLATVKEHRGIVDEAPKKKKPKKAEKLVLNARELKEKVSKLRGEKASAREAKDKKRVQVLRRRINRLKKQSRRAIQG